MTLRLRPLLAGVLVGALATTYSLIQVIFNADLYPTAPRLGAGDVVLAALAGIALMAVGYCPLTVLGIELALLLLADLTTSPAADSVQWLILPALAATAYRHRWSVVAAAFSFSWLITAINVVDTGVNAFSGSAGPIRALFITTILAAAVIAGRYVRELRSAALIAQERTREAEERRNLAAQSARLAERTQLAWELHDLLAHHISAIALRASAGEFGVTETGRTDEAVSALHDIKLASSETMEALRKLLAVLRDPETVAQPAPAADPVAAIDDAVRRALTAGLHVDVTIDPAISTAPALTRISAVRLVQEGLTNVAKHAGEGVNVTVAVTITGSAFSVIVSNSRPERPRPLLPESGHGLTGIRERVTLLGGSVTAGTSSDGGWRLSATWPLEEHR